MMSTVAPSDAATPMPTGPSVVSTEPSVPTLGSVLTTLGPVGIGVAASLGATVLIMHQMSEAAHGLAEKAQELRVFSEVTGLTAQQVQALRSEGSKFGLTGDEIQGAIQQFSARFNALRMGEGE